MITDKQIKYIRLGDRVYEKFNNFGWSKVIVDTTVLIKIAEHPSKFKVTKELSFNIHLREMADLKGIYLNERKPFNERLDAYYRRNIVLKKELLYKVENKIFNENIRY